jgi:nucleoside-diphosphate-sugar epimerase
VVCGEQRLGEGEPRELIGDNAQPRAAARRNVTDEESSVDCREPGYIGHGLNSWPGVHRLDAARLFRLALENAPAEATLHGVAEEGVPIRAIAEVIGRHLDLPVRTIAPQDADEHFSRLAGFLAMDSPASSTLTRNLLGWQPTHPGLIDDLDEGHYFQQTRRVAA